MHQYRAQQGTALSSGQPAAVVVAVEVVVVVVVVVVAVVEVL